MFFNFNIFSLRWNWQICFSSYSMICKMHLRTSPFYCREDESCPIFLVLMMILMTSPAFPVVLFSSALIFFSPKSYQCGDYNPQVNLQPPSPWSVFGLHRKETKYFFRSHICASIFILWETDVSQSTVSADSF